MSKAEILAELPRLNPGERRELLDRLYELDEAEGFCTAGPTEAEKALLDRELEEYQKNPAKGSPWQEVKARLRRPSS